MPSLAGLLAALAMVLALFWLAGGTPVPAAILTFTIGALVGALLAGAGLAIALSSLRVTRPGR